MNLESLFEVSSSGPDCQSAIWYKGRYGVGSYEFLICKFIGGLMLFFSKIVICSM